MRRWLHRDNMEYWSFVAQIIGAIGVIASVMYLAVQVGGNTTALNAQTHYNTLVLAQRPLEIIIADQELAAIVEKGSIDPDALTPAEWVRFGDYFLMAFNAWEYIHLLQGAGSIPDSLANGGDSYYRDLIRTKPGLARFWNEYKVAFADPFLAYVDAIFAEQAGAAAPAGE